MRAKTMQTWGNMQRRAVAAGTKRLLGTTRTTVATVGVISALGVVAVVPVQAAPPSIPREAAVTSQLAAGRAGQFTMLDRFAREKTQEGDADTSAYHIEHVTELQYRLKWAGVFHVGVTGTFGPITKAAVERFQRRSDLKVTGIAGHKTWATLLRHTIRHRKHIPNICKTKGWHACYDRRMHQVTLWHKGRMHNTWLVRGGGYDTPTRKGSTHVYYRDIDHVSRLFGTPMPYSQFFDGGQAYHGSPFMISPYVDHSHGCINMYIEDARQLWNLTADKRLNVTVYGRWD